MEILKDSCNLGFLFTVQFLMLCLAPVLVWRTGQGKTLCSGSGLSLSVFLPWHEMTSGGFVRWNTREESLYIKSPCLLSHLLRSARRVLETVSVGTPVMGFSICASSWIKSHPAGTNVALQYSTTCRWWGQSEYKDWHEKWGIPGNIDTAQQSHCFLLNSGKAEKRRSFHLNFRNSRCYLSLSGLFVKSWRGTEEDRNFLEKNDSWH